MPVLGLTMEEGTVAEWLKREGEPVAKDEPLLTVEMDKGTIEVPSPEAGVLERIVIQPGTTVPVRTVIAHIGSGVSHSRLFVTPRARRRARDLGVDLRALHGSGPHGRIVEADVLAVVAAAAAPTEAVTATPGAVLTPTLQPMSRVRQLTAERMAASAQSTARVTLFLEANFSEASRFRQQLQPEFARLGVDKLPWDAVIAKAAGLALVEHAALLSQWVDATALRTHANVDIGIAVALEPDGLVVPVLRDAAGRSLRELASDLLRLTDQARGGRLAPHDLQDGTFTITNLGAYRIDGFTPILNPPQTAILGVGRVADKAIVVEGRIESRTMCTLSLSFDHRVVDGAPAAAFLARLAELLERPYALLGI
jgi:pyruvate dehydrogenase E2 component (dihydrolipoyllysine-residue acetyltransferase)